MPATDVEESSSSNGSTTSSHSPPALSLDTNPHPYKFYKRSKSISISNNSTNSSASSTADVKTDCPIEQHRDSVIKFAASAESTRNGDKSQSQQSITKEKRTVAIARNEEERSPHQTAEKHAHGDSGNSEQKSKQENLFKRPESASKKREVRKSSLRKTTDKRRKH